MIHRPRVPDLTDNVCFRKTLFIFHLTSVSLGLCCFISEPVLSPDFLPGSAQLPLSSGYTEVYIIAFEGHKSVQGNNQYISTEEKKSGQVFKKPSKTKFIHCYEDTYIV